MRSSNGAEGNSAPFLYFLCCNNKEKAYEESYGSAGIYGKIHAVEMEPYKTYNVKMGTYHTHTLTEDAMVLIVEADDTCDDNSPIVRPAAEVTRRLTEMTKEISKQAG